MHYRFVCGVALLATFAACDGDSISGPDVPSDVRGPSPIGAPMPITIETVASGLVSPIQLVQPPGSDPRRFVVDQIGLIRVIDADGTLQAAPTWTSARASPRSTPAATSAGCWAWPSTRASTATGASSSTTPSRCVPAPRPGSTTRT